MSVVQTKKVQMSRSYVQGGKVLIDLWYADKTYERVNYDVPFKIFLKQTTNQKYLTGSGYKFNKSTFVDIDSDPLYEVEFKSMFDWNKAIRWFSNAKISTIYSTNYVWEYMVYHNLICNDYLDRYICLDIEVDPKGLDLKNISYEQPIVAVSLVGSDGKEWVFTVKVNDDLSVDKDEEINLINSIHAVVSLYDCILGWNLIDFDMTYIKERCVRLGLDLDWDKYPLFDLIRKYKEFLKRDRKPGEITNNKLDSAARRMLGEGKVEIDIHKYMKLLRDEPDKAKEYVLQDSRLVDKLYKVKGIGSQCRIDVAMSQKLHCFPTKTYPTYIFELYIDLKAREIGMRVPYEWKHYQKEVKKKGAGGLVLEPIRGLQQNIIALDYKSLYPNIIRTHNIGINNANWTMGKKDNFLINTKGLDFKKHVKSINSLIMEELIETRYKYRDLLDDPTISEEDKKWYGTMSDAYKLLLVSANGIYDQKNFKYRNQPIYEATTLTGQWYLRAAKKIAEDMGYTVYYGDSVMPNTPIVIRRNGFVEVIPIEDIHWAKSVIRSTREIKEDIEIWTDSGWSKIKYSFKHNVRKTGYRILTDKGYVETTEDHSLIINGKEVSPKDLKIGDKIERYRPKISGDIRFQSGMAWVLGFYAADGTRGDYSYGGAKKLQWRISNQNVSLLEKAQEYLLTIGFETKIIYAADNMKYLVPVGNVAALYEYFDMSHSKHNDEKIVPKCILNANLTAQNWFYTGYFEGDGHKSAIGIEEFTSIDYSLLEGITFMLDRNGKDYYISKRDDKLNTVRLRVRKTRARNRVPLEIISIDKFDIDGPVYDIETENHHFCGGLGGILLHNTDSIYVSSPYGDDYKKAVRSIPFIEEQLNEKLKEVAVKKFNLDPNNYTLDLRAEKIYSKIYFSEKKNYVGKMVWKEYEWLDSKDPKSIDVKGIVMMKYNTIPIVKEAMNEVFKILLSNLDDEAKLKKQFVLYLSKLKADLYSGKRDDLLVISQRVDSLDGYKSEPAHIRAAKKLDALGKFEPGMNVEYIHDAIGEVILYGIEKNKVSRRTYDKVWRKQVGKWVMRIAGIEIASARQLDFGYARPSQSL